MNELPRRRRMTEEPEELAEMVDFSAPDDDEAPRRRKRASVGGFHLKLTAPERKGYHRRWFNDTPGRLAVAEDLAYTHVEDGSIRSDGTDSRVRRLVGTQANGQPLYAYLMETPEREYAYGAKEKAEAIRANEEAIREGRSEQGSIENRYGSVKIEAR